MLEHKINFITDPTVRMLTVDLDERAYLFPEIRALTQLKFTLDIHGYLIIDVIFAHNASKLPPYLMKLGNNDARDLCFQLIDAVYRAQTKHVITETVRIAITVVTNGYILKIEDQGMQHEIYFSTVVIWKICNALCRMVDLQSPTQSN